MKKIFKLIPLAVLMSFAIAACDFNIFTTLVTGIVLDETELNLSVNETYQFTPTIFPADATIQSLRWTSNDESVSVSNGLVTAISEGEATVTATAKDRSGISATCNVTVSYVEATGISLSPTNLEIYTDQTSELVVTFTPSNTSNKNVAWGSSNEAVATVADGIVSGLTEGNTTITATSEDGGFTDTCTVNVTAAPVIQKTTMAYDYADYTNNNVYSIDSTPSSGNPKLLVIPVWFTDSSAYIKTETNKANVLSDISDVFFGTTSETGWHSVSSFYNEESKGRVNLTGTVSEWYNAGQSTSYYGDTSSGQNRTTALVTTASDWYFTNNPGDSRQNYDTDSDGYLDGVMLIYGAPDYSAANNSYKNLWAYCSWLQGISSISSPKANAFFWASYDFMYGSSTASSRAGTNFNEIGRAHV